MRTVAVTAHLPFCERLAQALREGLQKVGIEATVEVEPVRSTLLHRALAVSPQFAELGYMDRQEVVWRIINHYFSPEDKLYVSSVYTMTPDEMEGKA
jgi:hypothetical protein